MPRQIDNDTAYIARSTFRSPSGKYHLRLFLDGYGNWNPNISEAVWYGSKRAVTFAVQKATIRAAMDECQRQFGDSVTVRSDLMTYSAVRP
jgi:hypothetical protein